MNKASSIPWYLKHKIENDIVTESYVVFIVTPEMAQANPGMQAGTYELRGEKTNDKASDYISPYYEANKETLKTAYGYSTNPSRCEESGTGRNSSFICRVISLFVNAYADGNVFADNYNNSNCKVSPDGRSFCY